MRLSSGTHSDASVDSNLTREKKKFSAPTVQENIVESCPLKIEFSNENENLYSKIAVRKIEKKNRVTKFVVVMNVAKTADVANFDLHDHS